MSNIGSVMQKYLFTLAAILLSFLLLFSACQPIPPKHSLQQLPSTALPTPLITQPIPVNTPPITATPMLIYRENTQPYSAGRGAWLSYTNVNYSFSFQYPPQWKLLEQDKKEPHYIKLSTDSLIVIIGYKWNSENKVITGGGTLPGTLQSGGYTTILNQPTPKFLIIDQGKIKSIYYNGINAEIPILASSQGLVLSIRLIPAPGSEYHQIDIPESTQKELDEVLNSFTLHEKTTTTSLPSPLPPPSMPADWKQWENPLYGFRFYYPPDWTIEEQPHLVKVKRGSFALLIGYRYNEENINLGPNQLPPGELQTQYSIPFFNQQLTKQVLVYQNKQKALLYGNKEIAVFNPARNQLIHFVILGYDFQADYVSINLANQPQETIDRIVSSFHFYDGQPLPSSTLTPTNTLFLPSEPTWKDDFTRSDQWYLLQTANTNFSIKDGKLIMRAKAPNTIEEWGVSRISGIKDFYLEGNFFISETCSGLDRYGFLFRAPRPTEGYVVNFSCDGQYRLYIWDGSQYKPLIPWTPSTAIRSGANQTNALGVAAVGNTITIYANRVPLASVTDNTYQSGGFGLLIGSATTPNFTVFVDDVAYWQK